MGFKFSSRGPHHGASSFSGWVSRLIGKPPASRAGTGGSSPSWPAIQINLLNNLTPTCLGFEFNNDKWKLYYILNKEMVEAQMLKRCYKCFERRNYAGNNGLCGRYFSERFSYIVRHLKRSHWKNENQPT
jgi:hypothetical protein